MDEDTIDDVFPLISQDVLLFCGKMRSRAIIFKQSNAFIIPSFNCPLFRLLPNDFERFLKNEFIMYPKSIPEEFIVYQLNRTDINCLEFAFYKQNGKYENSVKLSIHGISNYSNPNICVSPNGRYICYVTTRTEDDKKRRIDLVSKMSKSKEQPVITDLCCRVCEFVSLRSREETVKIEKLIKKRKVYKDKFEQKLREQVKMDDVSFNLKQINEFDDVDNTLSLYRDRALEGESPPSQIYVTDTGNFILLDKDQGILLFNNVDLYTPNKKHIGYKPGTKDRNTIKSMNWTLSEKGVLCNSEEEIFYLGYNIKKDKPGKVMKIDFKINKDRLFIKDVICCPDSRYILICLSTNYDEYILLIWDLVTNKEMYNYSLETDYKYITKPDSKFGIILAHDFYINLDLGLINYYFDYNFRTFPWSSDDRGMKMDKNEKTILYKGKLLMKEMYSETEILQSLLDGRVVYNERTENEKLSSDQMKLQIYGNTIIHLYCIDYEPLTLMLEYMEKRKPYMLNSILMTNNKGETPIDVAIKYESLKTINVLLKYLSKLKDSSYSHLLRDRFNKLLSMNLISFHTYLES